MKIAKSPVELLEALKEHEMALANLYEVYADVFPECRDFWTDLSKDELQHANWIDALYARVKNSDEDFVAERFRVEPIKHSIKYVKQQAARAYEADFTLINALSTALQLEEALIENKYFEVFAGDSAQTQRTLALLADCTRTHHDKLCNFWQENAGG